MMMENSLVSVVLPCYNAEAYIEDAVESMLKQSYKNLEVIVVNDASTDGSLQKLKAITDERLKVITNNVNLGYPGSMNNGIAIAKGKYIARMDADDTCTLDRIKMQVELHEKHPNCAFVSAKRCLLSPNGIPYIREPQVNNDSYTVETWEELYNGTRKFTDPASLVLKTRIDEVGGYNTYQRTGMDVDLWFRIIELTKAEVLVLNKFVYQRRLIPNAITFSVNTNATEVFDKAYQRHPNKNNIAKKTVADGERLKPFIRSLTTTAVHCILVKDFNGAIAFYKKALSYKKHIFESIIVNTIKKYYSYKKHNTIQVVND